MTNSLVSYSIEDMKPCIIVTNLKNIVLTAYLAIVFLLSNFSIQPTIRNLEVYRVLYLDWIIWQALLQQTL